MLVAFLRSLAACLPCRDIPLPDGTPYLRRYRLGQLANIECYLHQYLGNDAERWLHNHPWRIALGIPLVGGYTEERLTSLDPYRGPITRLRRIRRFRPNVITDADFHRILTVRPGTWTLFLGITRYKEWGFLEESYDKDTPPGHVDILFRQPMDTRSARTWHRTPTTMTLGPALRRALRSLLSPSRRHTVARKP